MNNFEVTINESGETSGEILGITEERLEELMPLMFESINTSEELYQAISKMSKYAENPNELAFMSVSTVHYLEHRMQNNPLKKLLDSLISQSN